jgi:ferritin-like metal-binding protein YciE
MSLDNLEALLVEQLQDIYYAEKHLVKALPKMAKAASTADLKTAFTDHAEETRNHVSRLEQVFEALDVSAKAKKCPAIDGLIEEAGEMMEEEGAPAVLDAGLIASAQRVEHYEIAAYGNVRVFAEALGHADVVALLDATLGEEHAADKLLTEISSETVLPASLSLGSADLENEEEDAVETEANNTKKPARTGAGAGNASRRSR